MTLRRYPHPYVLAVGLAVACMPLGGCEPSKAARNALPDSGTTPRSAATATEPDPKPNEALPLAELDGTVRELESALDLLMVTRHGPDARPLEFPDDPPAVMTPPAPFDVSAIVPRTPVETIVDGMPPEDTLPADSTGGLLRLWSEGDNEQEAPMMADSTHREVALLRRDIQRLNHNLESLLQHYVGSLHEENERLRQEIQRLYVMRMQEGRYDSVIPRPNAGVLDTMREEAFAGGLPPMDGGIPTMRITTEPVPLGPVEAASEPEPAPPALEDGPGVMAMAALGGIQYAIVEEWGRTPEEARQFGNEVTSLKGLIIAVPPGLSNDSLTELTQHMRAEYDAFDNINVKVFEGLEPAQRFARNNEVTPGTLVADVTKHAASQRDLIVLMRGEEVTVLPTGTGAAAEAAAQRPGRPSLLDLLSGAKPVVPEDEADETDSAETPETPVETPDAAVESANPGEEAIPDFNEVAPIFAPVDEAGASPAP